MGRRNQATVQTGVEGRPVQHAETLPAAAAMLGLSERQLRTKARQLRIALPFTKEGCRS